jgi:hypothetical protein
MVRRGDGHHLHQHHHVLILSSRSTHVIIAGGHVGRGAPGWVVGVGVPRLGHLRGRGVDGGEQSQ